MLFVIRETIAMAEELRHPVCMFSVDFHEAFDRIAHTYLFAVLEHYGFGPTIVGNIRHLYEGATSVAQVNGFHTRQVDMARSI
jgi:hypothetical protein